MHDILIIIHKYFKSLQASNFTEFDSAMTVHIFGYKSVVDYYADACLVEKLDKIKIPYLALISSDDPFIPSFSKHLGH